MSIHICGNYDPIRGLSRHYSSHLDWLNTFDNPIIYNGIYSVLHIGTAKATWVGDYDHYIVRYDSDNDTVMLCTSWLNEADSIRLSIPFKNIEHYFIDEIPPTHIPHLNV